MRFVAPEPAVIVVNDPVEARQRARKEFWTNFGMSAAVSFSAAFVTTAAVLAVIASRNNESESEDEEL